MNQRFLIVCIVQRRGQQNDVKFALRQLLPGLNQELAVGNLARARPTATLDLSMPTTSDAPSNLA